MALVSFFERTWLFALKLTGQGAAVKSASHSRPQTPTLRRDSMPTISRHAFSRGNSARERSDSDMSDGEMGGINEEWKLRVQALACLQIIAELNPRSLHAHWSKFFSTDHDRDSPSIVALVSSPVPGGTDLLQERRARLAACAAIQSMLEDSATFLGGLDARPVKTSFVSLGERIASHVRKLHIDLFAATDISIDKEVKAGCLKCIWTLAKNCPYDKFAMDYPIEIASKLSRYIRPSESPSVLTSALEAVSAVLVSSPRAVGRMFLLETAQTNTRAAPFLQNVLEMSRTGGPTESILIRCKALEFLASVTVVCEDSKESFCNLERLVKPIIDGILSDQGISAMGVEHNIRLAAMGTLECLMNIAGQYSEAFTASWWTTTLSLTLGVLGKDGSPVALAAVLNCLACLGPPFHFLPDRDRNALKAVTLGQVAHEESSVRAAAARTLGVLAAAREVEQDSLFVEDLAEALITLNKDDAFGVRLKASWGLANLCDKAANLMGAAPTSLIDTSMPPISDELISNLLASATTSCRDNDKCRGNGVRAVGNLLKRVELPWTRCHSVQVEEAVRSLVGCLGSGSSVKTRWNAARAVSNLLRNPALPIDSAPWSSTLILALIDCMKPTCKNFKVRAYAAEALCAPVSLERYGGRANAEHVHCAVKECLEQLKESDITGPQEWQHRDQLEKQATLAHLNPLLAL
ncbi:HEAT repeat-containing protein 6 [Gonapodya sp. JEL0774]|nr:HEAT repeat-containing protein 6 [Gonapodya sp. JEL0774]